METPSLTKPGTFRLPPGFRFHPTDEELVLQYLKRKAFSFPLPAAIIPEIDLGKFDPWDLPGGCEQERYFFHLRAAKYPNGRRVNRAMGSGYWKATGKDKLIIASKSNQVVGRKKVLLFYHGKPPAGCRTNWFMHEYCLAGAGAGADAGVFSFGKNKLVHSTVQSRREWVLCRIFEKRRAVEEDGEGEGLHHQEPERFIRCINFVRGDERDRSNHSNSVFSTSSSELSCVTESNGEVSSPT